MKNLFQTLILGGCVFFLGFSCKRAETEKVEEAVIVDEVVLIEYDWIIDEHHINEVPVTNHPHAKPRKKESAIEPEKIPDAPYVPVKAPELVSAVSLVHEIDNPIVEVSEVIIPLEETQTVSSFNKKGKDTGAVQVVSNTATDEIDHIIFQDKNHKDYYDVSAGMSGKEVRKLRRELKHMAHRGQVFFYSDDSNIMYLTDIKYADGEEIVEADLDETFVTAVVWKDKNHKNHPKHSKK